MVVDEPLSGDTRNEPSRDFGSDITRLAREIAQHDEASVGPDPPVMLPRFFVTLRIILLLVGVTALVVAAITRDASLVVTGVSNIVIGALQFAMPVRPRGRRTGRDRRWS